MLGFLFILFGLTSIVIIFVVLIIEAVAFFDQRNSLNIFASSFSRKEVKKIMQDIFNDCGSIMRPSFDCFRIRSINCKDMYYISASDVTIKGVNNFSLFQCIYMTILTYNFYRKRDNKDRNEARLSHRKKLLGD